MTKGMSFNAHLNKKLFQKVDVWESKKNSSKFLDTRIKMIMNVCMRDGKHESKSKSKIAIMYTRQQS